MIVVVVVVASPFRERVGESRNTRQSAYSGQYCIVPGVQCHPACNLNKGKNVARYTTKCDHVQLLSEVCEPLRCLLARRA